MSHCFLIYLHFKEYSESIFSYLFTFQRIFPYFFTFQGHCGSGREDLFSCNNSRCIDKKFTCQNWNACGDNSDCPTNIDYEEIVKYFIYGAVAVVGIGVLYFLYKCAKCTKKCIDKCFDCCTDCVDDCDCSCCTDLAGGIVDGCRRLKSTVTSRIGVCYILFLIRSECLTTVNKQNKTNHWAY